MFLIFIAGLAVCSVGGHILLDRLVPFAGPPVQGFKQAMSQVVLSSIAILSLVLCLTGASSVFSDDLRDSAEHPPLYALAGIIPAIETVLFNLIPLSLVSRIKTPSFPVAVLLQTFVFLVVHMVMIGPWSGFPVGLSAGFVLAMLYTSQMPSHSRAFALTTVTHGFYNAIIFFLSQF